MALVGNFNGIDQVFGATPPVLGIAVSPETVVLSSGDSVVILSKEGTLLAASSLREFFDPVRTKVEFPYFYDEGLSDPTDTFDPLTQRFFLATTGRGFPPDCPPDICTSDQKLAVSRSANPASTSGADWFFYSLNGTLESLGVRGVDQAHVGSSDEVIVILSGFDAFPGGQGGNLIRVLPKAKLVRGEPVSESDWVDIKLTITDFQAIHGFRNGFRPVEHLDRPPNGTFFMIAGPPNCTIAVLGIDDALASPEISHQIVQPTGPARQCGIAPTNPPQPGGRPLAIEDVIGPEGNAVYRNGSIWYVEFIEFRRYDFSVIRWVQIDVSNWPGPPTVVQDSVFGVEGFWHFFPAITVDASNNVAIVYGRSNNEEFPSAYYTGRLASDPPNTLRPGTILKAGAASLDTGLVGLVHGAERYGVWFGAAIDPADGSAWLLGEYVKAPRCWGSWVAHVSFESSTLGSGLTSEPTPAREPQTTCPREGFGTPLAGHFEVRFETALAPGTLSIAPGDATAYRFRVIGNNLRSLSPSEREQAVETPLGSPWYYDGSTNLYVFLEPGAPPRDYALVIHLPDGSEALAAFAHPSPTSPSAPQLLEAERILVSENFDEGVDGYLWDLVGSADYSRVDDFLGGVFLTSPLNGQLGYLFSKQLINTQRFNVSFSVSTVAGNQGEGFAFVLSRRIPTEADAQRATGAGAFGFNVLDGIAIEFDTRPGDRGDPSLEHVGLDMMPSGDALAAQEVAFSLRDKGPYDVEIAFDSGHVRVDVSNPFIGLARTRVLDYAIPDFVPFDGYFGFVGATGDGTDAHVIHDVVFDGLTASTFSATAPPTGPSASPAPD